MVFSVMVENIRARMLTSLIMEMGNNAMGNNIASRCQNITIMLSDDISVKKNI